MTFRAILIVMGADAVADASEDPEPNPFRTHINWILLLRQKRQYKTCIHTAALAKHGQLETALMGEWY